MKFPEYEEFDARGLAELVNKKQISEKELLQAAVERLELRNGKIHAVIHSFIEEAQDQAMGLKGRFAAVPFLIKSLGVAVKNQPFNYGLHWRPDWTAKEDNTLIQRYRKAGFNLFGLTNTPQFGLNLTTEPQHYKPSKNPWNLAHIAGGSSGGAAAAVAAGIVPAAHASDGGGSIRVPAACCGVFGLKPTRGRNPMGPWRAEGWAGLVVDHVITRSVADSAAILDSTAGAEVGAPYVAPIFVKSFEQALSEPLPKLNIGLALQSTPEVDIHPECAAAAQQTAAWLADMGHQVELINLDYAEQNLNAARNIIITANLFLNIHEVEQKFNTSIQAELEPMVQEVALQGAKHSSLDYIQALNTMHLVVRQFAEATKDFDLLITPCTAQAPVELGRFSTQHRDFNAFSEQLFAFAPFVGLYNATGQPAASIPLHFSESGLPIGTQIIAQFGREDVLLKACYALEQAHPWHARRAWERLDQNGKIGG